jgi:hypothetical protein
MMLKSIGLTMALAIAVLGSNGAEADGAGDWKGYPGSNCLAHSGANDVRRLTSGTISNWQNSRTTVHCPVVRDVAAGGNNRVWNVVVRGFNNHSTQGGNCRLIVRTLSGSVFAWQQASWPSGYGEFQLNLGPLNASNWGNYHLYCSLPPAEGARKTAIRNYAVDERGWCASEPGGRVRPAPSLEEMRT